MKRNFVLAAILGAFLFSLSSCGTMRRADKDLFVTVTSPAIILYGAGTDGLDDAQNIQQGLEAGDGTQALFLPFTFIYRAFDHTICCALHALDFFAFPAYGVAELHPAGPEIKPLQIYTGTFFDLAEDKSGGDVETGEGK